MASFHHHQNKIVFVTIFLLLLWCRHAGNAFSSIPRPSFRSSFQIFTKTTLFGRRFNKRKAERAVPDVTTAGVGDYPKPPSVFSMPSPSTISSTSTSTTQFDFVQRIESFKTAALGALVGGIAVTPITFLHYVPNIAQWEFATDMSALQAALFAIVFRYTIRGDTNPMLNQGCVGAFVLVRTLSNIEVTSTCSAIPLQCGAPLGYFDWNMIGQIISNGVESAVLFGAVAYAMEQAFDKGWISKFR